MEIHVDGYNMGIWNQRNCFVFKNTVDLIEIFTVAQMKVWAWVNYKFSKSKFSYFDWCTNLYVCLNSSH